MELKVTEPIRNETVSNTTLITNSNNNETNFFNPPNIHLTPADKRTADGYSRSCLGGFGVRTEIPGALGAGHYKHILASLGNRYRVICVGDLAASPSWFDLPKNSKKLLLWV